MKVIKFLKIILLAIIGVIGVNLIPDFLWYSWGVIMGAVLTSMAIDSTIREILDKSLQTLEDSKNLSEAILEENLKLRRKINNVLSTYQDTEATPESAMRMYKDIEKILEKNGDELVGKLKETENQEKKEEN